jgi:hypothetical protein
MTTPHGHSGSRRRRRRAWRPPRGRGGSTSTRHRAPSTTDCSQSTIGPVARFPIGVPNRVIRCRRSGVTCPPHQASAAQAGFAQHIEGHQAEAQVPADRQHDHIRGEAEAGEGGARSDRPVGAVSGSHGRSLTAPTAPRPTQQSRIGSTLLSAGGTFGPDATVPCVPLARLLGVSPGYLVFVRGECAQNLPLLPLGHLEDVKRSRELSRDFVELGGRDFSWRCASSKPRGVLPGTVATYC